MKRYVYLNQFLKDNSAQPKVVLQEGKRITYVNEVRFDGYVVLKVGKLEEAPEHDVRAWLEPGPNTAVYTS